MSAPYAGALVFATAMEAEPFLNKMAVSQIARFPFTVYSVNDRRTRNLLVAICGMGLESAALAVDHLINHYRPSRILNCGIAGSLSDAYTVGDILRIAMVANTNDKQTPSDLSQLEFLSLPCDIPTYPGGLLTARLASQAVPVFNVDRRSLLADYVDLVDMEGWAVASVCQRYGLSCGMLKVVSDHAEDRETLLQNLTHTSRRLAEFVSYFIDVLIPSEIDYESQRSLIAS